MHCSTRDRLTELVAPPRTVTAVDWAGAEAALGIRFPTGYRWLAETYGPGVFDNFLRLLVPGPDETTSERGLLVWARTVDRVGLSWATAGPPDEWPVVVENVEAVAAWRHDGPCEDLLLMMLEGTVEVPYIPHESFEDPHSFTPLETSHEGSRVLRGIRRLLPF